MSRLLDVEKLLNEPDLEIPRVCLIQSTAWDEMQDHLRNQSGLHAFAMVQYRLAEADVRNAEDDYKKAYNRLWVEAREKGHSVDHCGMEADLAPTVERLRAKLRAEQRKMYLWRALVEGLEGRASMLQQISARQREELKKNWLEYNNPPNDKE